MYGRDLFDYLMDMVNNPSLFSQMEFNAQRLYKYDGMSWKRFYDEPYTADHFWTAQVRSQFITCIERLT